MLAKGEFKPKLNGIAILPEGGWLLAHLGEIDGGGEIDIGLFQYYDALPKRYDVRFLSVDAASGRQSDVYSVI